MKKILKEFTDNPNYENSEMLNINYTSYSSNNSYSNHHSRDSRDNNYNKNQNSSNNSNNYDITSNANTLCKLYLVQCQKLKIIL